MASISLEDFKADIYSRDLALPELPSDASFFSLLKRAIVNASNELRSFEPSVFEGWLENQSSPVTFPDDLNQDKTTLIYPENDQVNPIGIQYISTRNGKWHIEAHDNFSIKYPKDIARFTALSNTLPFKSEKSQEILISEMMALINAAFEQNEATASVTNALTQSNRIQ